MFDVKIYGEIVPFQDTWIAENGYFNLTLLNQQLEQAKGQTLLVRINSFGGDVEEGFAIYQALRRYAIDNKVEITTRCDGRCASIATVIFLAGDKRIVNEYISPFIHNAWTYVEGDAKELARVAVELEEVNLKIANHYVQHTDLELEEALQLMQNETSITPDECVRIRFATEIEKIERPKALFRFNKPLKSNLMSNKNKKAGILARMLSVLGALNLEVFTDTNDVLDFFELGDGDVPKVGDKANYNGEPAEGSYTLADGKTQYTFAGGVLTEIVEDSGASANESEEILALRQQVADLTAENEGLKAAQTSEVKALKSKLKAMETLTSEFKAALLDEEDKGGTGGEKPVDPNEKFKNFKLKK